MDTSDIYVALDPKRQLLEKHLVYNVMIFNKFSHHIQPRVNRHHTDVDHIFAYMFAFYFLEM